MSTASEAVSWGTPALAAGAAALMTGIRLKVLPGRGARGETAAEGSEAEAEALDADGVGTNLVESSAT
jgi:hypothetical protein